MNKRLKRTEKDVFEKKKCLFVHNNDKNHCIDFVLCIYVLFWQLCSSAEPASVT